MLKKLLAGTLVVMLVVGISGMAMARGHHRRGTHVDIDIDIDKTVDCVLNFDLGVEALNYINLSEITQDGVGDNYVGTVTQGQGANFSEIYQDGWGNGVGAVSQLGDMYNLSIITQQGNSNWVEYVDQGE